MGAVAAAGIGEDQQVIGFGITPSAVVAPPLFDRLDGVGIRVRNLKLQRQNSCFEARIACIDSIGIPPRPTDPPNFDSGASKSAHVLESLEFQETAYLLPAIREPDLSPEVRGGYPRSLGGEGTPEARRNKSAFSAHCSAA